MATTSISDRALTIAVYPLLMYQTLLRPRWNRRIRVGLICMSHLQLEFPSRKLIRLGYIVSLNYPQHNTTDCIMPSRPVAEDRATGRNRSQPSAVASNIMNLPREMCCLSPVTLYPNSNIRRMFFTGDAGGPFPAGAPTDCARLYVFYLNMYLFCS